MLGAAGRCAGSRDLPPRRGPLGCLAVAKVTKVSKEHYALADIWCCLLDLRVTSLVVDGEWVGFRYWATAGLGHRVNCLHCFVLIGHAPSLRRAAFEDAKPMSPLWA